MNDFDQVPDCSTTPPDVGDIVHYFYPEEDIPFAAIITGTAESSLTVDLCVISATGFDFSLGVPHVSEGLTRHRWEWRDGA